MDGKLIPGKSNAFQNFQLKFLQMKCILQVSSFRVVWSKSRAVTNSQIGSGGGKIRRKKNSMYNKKWKKLEQMLTKIKNAYFCVNYSRFSWYYHWNIKEGILDWFKEIQARIAFKITTLWRFL